MTVLHEWVNEVGVNTRGVGGSVALFVGVVMGVGGSVALFVGVVMGVVGSIGLYMWEW